MDSGKFGDETLKMLAQLCAVGIQASVAEIFDASLRAGMMIEISIAQGFRGMIGFPLFIECQIFRAIHVAQPD